MKAKSILYRLLKDKIKTCEGCILHKCRKHIIFGEGYIHSKLMIVGDAPGDAEDESGQIFMGKAGQKLNQILRYYKISRDNVYITNAICCRPPDNRAPLYSEEIVPCRHRLACQIALIQPTVILGLGGISAQALLGDEVCKEAESLSGLFNKMHIIKVDDQDFPVIISYHPSRLLEESCDASVKAATKTHWDRAVGFLDIENS